MIKNHVNKIYLTKLKCLFSIVFNHSLIVIDEKFELLHVVDKKLKTKSEIARDFGINPSTLSEIIKRKDVILKLLCLEHTRQKGSDSDQDSTKT